MDLDLPLSESDEGPRLDCMKLIEYVRKDLKWRDLDTLASRLLDPFPAQLCDATYADCDTLHLFVD